MIFCECRFPTTTKRTLRPEIHGVGNRSPIGVPEVAAQPAGGEEPARKSGGPASWEGTAMGPGRQICE